MGKRKHEDEEYIKKKMRKLEKKLQTLNEEKRSSTQTPPLRTPIHQKSPTPTPADVLQPEMENTAGIV